MKYDVVFRLRGRGEVKVAGNIIVTVEAPDDHQAQATATEVLYEGLDCESVGPVTEETPLAVVNRALARLEGEG